MVWFRQCGSILTLIGELGAAWLYAAVALYLQSGVLPLASGAPEGTRASSSFWGEAEWNLSNTFTRTNTHYSSRLLVCCAA